MMKIDRMDLSVYNGVKMRTYDELKDAERSRLKKVFAKPIPMVGAKTQPPQTFA
jgi:hypothetical protein